MKVFQDPWMLRLHSFKPMTVPSPETRNMMVSELLDENGGWRWNSLIDVFWEVDRAEVRRIPVRLDYGDDKLIWHFDVKGEYSVKSGSHLAMKVEESNSNGETCGHAKGLKRLWKMRLPNKIKIHIWRLLFNAIPVRSNLITRGVDVEPFRPWCKKLQEDIRHITWYCKFVQKVWRMSELWPKLHGFKRGGFGDLFQWIFERGVGYEFERFVMICWSLWFERNQVVFNNKIKDWEDVIIRARRLGENFFTTEHVPNSFDLQQSLCHFWRPPPVDFIKVNVDASVTISADSYGVGLVGRDSNGQVLFAEGRCYSGSVSSFVAELRAVEEGLKMTFNLGYDHMVLESDALQVINAIHDFPPLSADGHMIGLVRKFASRFQIAKIKHCSSLANSVE